LSKLSKLEVSRGFRILQSTTESSGRTRVVGGLGCTHTPHAAHTLGSGSCRARQGSIGDDKNVVGGGGGGGGV
jgi:hypothetical protein